jgi:hypothetical protein
MELPSRAASRVPTLTTQLVDLKGAPLRAFLVVVSALIALSLGVHQSQAANGTNYHLNSRTDWAVTECGTAFSGWIHEQQEFNLNANGMLAFHYEANGEGTGVDQFGHTLKLHLENIEVDHIMSTTVPNLGSGSLEDWVEANMDIIVEMHANYFEHINGQGSTRLMNHAIFQVNHNGTHVDKVMFKAENCPPTS